MGHPRRYEPVGYNPAVAKQEDGKKASARSGRRTPVAEGRDDDGMRAGVGRVAVMAVVVALLLLAVPLGVVSRMVLNDRAHNELELTARSTSLAVGPLIGSADPVELPHGEPSQTVGVYDASGALRAGRGPSTLGPVERAALTGSGVDTANAGELVVALPVASGERVQGVVRVAESDNEVWRQVALAWAAILAAAGIALFAAVLVARWQARSLTGPLERLAVASQHASEGDLTVAVPPSGVPEIDQVARTHNEMLQRLTRMIARERHISTDASHQLRTPLAGLQLELEAALADRSRTLRPVVQDTLHELARLQDTIDHVLQLARTDPTTQATLGRWAPLTELIEEVEQRWHGPLAQRGRRLQVHTDLTVSDAAAPARVLDQVLEILLDNASKHGAGTVTVTVRDAVGSTAIDVRDEGTITDAVGDPFARGVSGSADGTGHGIGLALARTMAENAGGRIRLTSREPTTFSLFLPQPDHGADEPGPAGGSSAGPPLP